jgi:hypothetical protein
MGVATIFRAQQDSGPCERRGEWSVDAREISVRFAEAFCAGDLPRLASLLSPSFRLSDPLAEYHGRDHYLAALERDPPHPAPCRVIQLSGGEHDAAILYEYAKAPTPVLVAQFNRVSNGLISEARLVFATGDDVVGESAP